MLNSKLGTLRFGVDGDGNCGYYKGDDTFVPFRSKPKIIDLGTGSSGNISNLVQNVEDYSSENFISFIESSSYASKHGDGTELFRGITTSINAISKVVVSYNKNTGGWSRTSPSITATGSERITVTVSAPVTYRTYFIC